MSGLTLTRKGRQWAEKRGRSSKSFQDQSGSTLFGLEMPLPPPRLSHVWAPTLPFNSGGKTRQTHRAQTFLHSAGQQLAKRPGGCGAPQGAKVYQSLFVEPQEQMFWLWALGGWDRAGHDSAWAPTGMPVPTARPRGHML